jgi:hypothetical protein
MTAMEPYCRIWLLNFRFQKYNFRGWSGKLKIFSKKYLLISYQPCLLVSYWSQLMYYQYLMKSTLQVFRMSFQTSNPWYGIEANYTAHIQYIFILIINLKCRFPMVGGRTRREFPKLGLNFPRTANFALWWTTKNAIACISGSLR